MSNTNKSNNDTEDVDEEEKMRLAFQAFMLTGKVAPTEGRNDDTSSKPTSQTTSNASKKKKKKKRQSTGTVASKQITVAPTQSKQSTPQKGSGSTVTYPSPNRQNQSTKKRYYQLLRSFSDKIQYTWMDTDDQILSVLENIVSIRGRLPMEWKLRKRMMSGENCPEIDEGEVWKYCGFQGKPKEADYSFHLQVSDVQLALDHDMTQHEKMIAALRSLMTTLSDFHESLGRLVDTIWQFHLDCCEEISGDAEKDGEEVTLSDEMETLVQNATDLFQMLSVEMYRKQTLITFVVDTTQNDIFGANKQKLVETEGDEPLKVVRKCCKAWPRTAPESSVDERLMMWALALGSSS